MERTFYNKKRIIITLQDYEHISFIATNEIEEILNKGYLKFRTCGENFDKGRHKQRAIIPVLTANKLFV